VSPRTAARWVPTAIVVAFVGGCDPETEVEPQAGDAVAHGRALFHAPLDPTAEDDDVWCATCHATGEEAESPGRILPGGSLAGVVHRPTFWGGAENDLLRSVNHCRTYFMLETEPWTASDVEARAIYAYLAAISGGAQGREAVPFTVVGAVSEVGPGDPERGRQVYAASCFACHGARTTGISKQVIAAPTLPEDTLAAHPLGEYTEAERRLVFIEKIRHGGFLGYGGQMPPYSLEVLPDSELADLIAYLGLP
jgi:thiosulfate dehydrogenase